MAHAWQARLSPATRTKPAVRHTTTSTPFGAKRRVLDVNPPWATSLSCLEHLEQPPTAVTEAQPSHLAASTLSQLTRMFSTGPTESFQADREKHPIPISPKYICTIILDLQAGAKKASRLSRMNSVPC